MMFRLFWPEWYAVWHLVFVIWVWLLPIRTSVATKFCVAWNRNPTLSFWLRPCTSVRLPSPGSKYHMVEEWVRYRALFGLKMWTLTFTLPFATPGGTAQPLVSCSRPFPCFCYCAMLLRGGCTIAETEDRGWPCETIQPLVHTFIVRPEILAF